LEDWHAFWLGNEPDRGLQIFPMRSILIVAEDVQSDEMRDSDRESAPGLESDVREWDPKTYQKLDPEDAYWNRHWERVLDL